jgi:hypothetical protein
MFNGLDTTGLGPQDIVILLACGAIIGLIAGIYLIWRASQLKDTVQSDDPDNASTRDPQAKEQSEEPTVALDNAYELDVWKCSQCGQVNEIRGSCLRCGHRR